MNCENCEESVYVIDKLAKLLAEIAVIVNGPEPPLTRWSYHDLPEKVRALKQAPPAAADGVQRNAERYEKIRASRIGDKHRVEIRLWSGDSLTYGQQLSSAGLDAAIDALPPAPPAAAVPMVTRESALYAIAHLSLHNGPGRVESATAMLKQAPPAAAVCTPDSSMDADSGHVSASLVQAPPAAAVPSRGFLRACVRTQRETALADAVQVVFDAMRADPDYAWSWHCNIAMAFVDEGGDHATASHAAARFMRLLAGVDPAYELPAKQDSPAAADALALARMALLFAKGEALPTRAQLEAAANAVLQAPPAAAVPWTEDRLRMVADSRGWKIRSWHEPTPDGQWRYPFEVTIPSGQLCAFLAEQAPKAAAVSADACPACEKNSAEHRWGYSASACKQRPPVTQAQPAAAVPEGYAAALAEVERATRKFPTWPTDPLHALAVLGEEFGELTKAVLQTVYEPHKVEPGELRNEAIQTAAMALRFIASLDAYSFDRSEQHEQGVARA